MSTSANSDEYPWLTDRNATTDADVAAPAPVASPDRPAVITPQDFLLELGSEELPPHDVVDGIAQIDEKLDELLAAARLELHDLRVTGTPRRLVAYVTNLAPRQTDEVVEKRGPALDRAFDSRRHAHPGRRRLCARPGRRRARSRAPRRLRLRRQAADGQPTLDVLPELCRNLLDGLRWDKIMRWNTSGVGYPRPLRWIVALYGEHVVPFTWADVTSGAHQPRPTLCRCRRQAGPRRVHHLPVPDRHGLLRRRRRPGHRPRPRRTPRPGRRAGGRDRCHLPAAPHPTIPTCWTR